jgi:hypothetical protein
LQFPLHVANGIISVRHLDQSRELGNGSRLERRCCGR